MVDEGNEPQPGGWPGRVIEAVGTQSLSFYEAALDRLQEFDREALVALVERGLGWEGLTAVLHQPSVEKTRTSVAMAVRRMAVEMSGSGAKDAVDERFETLVEAVADRVTVNWDAEIQGTGAERALLENLRVVDRIADALRERDTFPERLGEFELVREIGRGGMGVVYEARQVSLNRRVALKILPPSRVLSRQAAQRFRREAHAAAKLNHTNIVPVYATGEESGHLFYAMEQVDGPSLDRILSEVRGGRSNALLRSSPDDASSGSVGTSAGYASRSWFDTVAALIAEVAQALQYAHTRGVIHRDIKPANLLYSAEGRLSITDFGLARIADEPVMTMSRAMLGTPVYMSPEQISLDADLDHRVDIYSLGAVLYEMLTLERVARGKGTEQILHAILTQEPIRPRRLNHRIPLDLETVCLKALDKNPARRYQEAGQMAADLRRYLEHTPITARRESPLRRASKFVRRHPLAATVTVAAVVVVLLGSFAWQASRQRTIEVARRSVADARYYLSQGDYRKGLVAVHAAQARAPDLPDARLIRGRLLIMLGRHDEAVAEAEGMLARDPDDWTAHLVLAAAGSRVPTIPVEEHVAAVEAHAPDTADAHHLRALLIESPAEAIEHLNRALELDPAHAGALLARAQCFIDLKDFPAALRDGERLAAIRPRSSQGRRMIAWVHYQLHDPELALAEYERAIELDPDDPLTYLWRAWVHKAPTEYRQVRYSLPATGRYREAVDDLTRAIELDPDYAVHHRERADAYYKLGEFEAAVRDARRAIELDPNDLAAYSTWGYALLYLGRRDEIRALADQIPAAIAGWTDHRALADGLIMLATAYQAVEMLEAAFAEADRAVEVAPDYFQTYFFRAWLRRNTGDLEGLGEDILGAASVEIFDPNELVLRGVGLWASSRADLALADYDRAVEQSPHWADPYYLRARAYQQQGRFEESLADCERAISLAPRWIELYVYRGQLLASMERFDAALGDFETALALDERNFAALFGRAEVRLRTGRTGLAFADFDRLVELDPGDAWVHSARAHALFVTGHVDEARAAIDAAIERSPGNPQFCLRRATYQLYGVADCAAALADLERAKTLAPSTWIWIDHAITRIRVADLAPVCPLDFDRSTALASAHAAVDIDSSDPELRATLGLALYRDGQFVEARRALEEALQLDRQPEAGTLFSLAMTTSALGDLAVARSHYERAVERMEQSYPHHPGLERRRNEAGRASMPTTPIPALPN